MTTDDPGARQGSEGGSGALASLGCYFSDGSEDGGEGGSAQGGASDARPAGGRGGETDGGVRGLWEAEGPTDEAAGEREPKRRRAPRPADAPGNDGGPPPAPGRRPSDGEMARSSGGGGPPHPAERGGAGLPPPASLGLVPRAPVAAAGGVGELGGPSRAGPPRPSMPPRAFPHIEGNYPLHVFFELELDGSSKRRLRSWQAALAAEAARARIALELCPGAAAELPPGGIASGALAGAPDPAPGGGGTPPPPLPLHVSLSRTAPIRRVQASGVLAELRRRLGKACGQGGAVTLRLPRLMTLPSDTGGRAFLAAAPAAAPVSSAVSPAGPPLYLAAISATDAALGRYGLPRYHAEPLPHVSLAWASGGGAAEGLLRVAGATSVAREWARGGSSPGGVDDGQGLVLVLSRVVCRIGSRDTVVWEPRRGRGRGTGP